MTSLATPSSASDQRVRSVPRWVAPVLIANIVAQVGIVVTGGLVRVTGSGLGCPTWPECAPGSFTPTVEQAEGWHKYVEFGNRLLTFVLAAIAIASLFAAWRYLRRRHLTVAAAAVLVGVVLQAVIGGITVLAGLHPITVSIHFMVSCVLIAAASYLWFARDEPSLPRGLVVPRLVAGLAWVTVAVGVVVLTLGTVVTGSGPHSGDAETPARYGFDPRVVSWLHADTVMLFVGLVVGTWIAVRLTARTARAATAWRDVFIVTMAQGVVGYVQYFTGLPEVLVLAHMLGAGLLVVALTRAVVAVRTAGGTHQVPVASAAYVDAT
ncbi:heme A synthase [Nostocoides sp. F2B08]|uniref:COX15/CtaA family protein n=1 Tax=Nostocoides sp. F2B08 TaxID=2653936 RepID=UPI0012632872|nr:COX15/CtaA family protein [Tetrasphaera sp. F2B08]KAB7744533.1 heme A synthase [Tetrasphaera sp. F2B08]